MSQWSFWEERKKDSREKIELGGLVVKAGLRTESRRLLLGLLLDGRRRIETDAAECKRLTMIGAEAFSNGGD